MLCLSCFFPVFCVSRAFLLSFSGSFLFVFVRIVRFLMNFSCFFNQFWSLRTNFPHANHHFVGGFYACLCCFVFLYFSFFVGFFSIFSCFFMVVAAVMVVEAVVMIAIVVIVAIILIIVAIMEGV